MSKLDKLASFLEIAKAGGRIQNKFSDEAVEEIQRLGFSRPFYKSYCAIVDLKGKHPRPLNSINRLEAFLKTLDPSFKACHVSATINGRTYNKVAICLKGDEKKAAKAVFDSIGGA